jgi:hypothetical protein
MILRAGGILGSLPGVDQHPVRRAFGIGQLNRLVDRR